MKKTLYILLCLPVVFAACASQAKSAPPATETIAPTVESELISEEPCADIEITAEETEIVVALTPTVVRAASGGLPLQLSDNLTYACDPAARGSQRPQVGEPAIDFYTGRYGRQTRIHYQNCCLKSQFIWFLVLSPDRYFDGSVPPTMKFTWNMVIRFT